MKTFAYSLSKTPVSNPETGVFISLFVNQFGLEYIGKMFSDLCLDIFHFFRGKLSFKLSFQGSHLLVFNSAWDNVFKIPHIRIDIQRKTMKGYPSGSFYPIAQIFLA